MNARASFLLLLLLLAPTLAPAHTSPARRSIAITANDEELIVLVTWTLPIGEGSEVWAARAGWGRARNDARDALTASMAGRALAPLSILIDGQPIALANMETKLVEDPPKSGRLSVAVLATTPLKLGDALVVSVDEDTEPTRLNCSAAPDAAVILDCGTNSGF